MRPQQQGRRQRNRNSGGGGRRSQNPLSRNYESNGPDVKIRGNAQVIADKYATLARDALSSGDNVMAENYLQHAEHYNRIIMAAQAQAQAQREERSQSDDSDDSGDDEQTAASGDSGERSERKQRDRRDHDRKPNGEATPNGKDASEAPQPVIGETPVEVTLEEQEQAASGSSRRTSPRRPRKPRRTEEQSSVDGESAGESSSGDGEAVAAEA